MKNMLFAYITMILLGVIVIILLSIISKYRAKLKNLDEELKEQKYRYEYDMHKAEILSLQSQINPHFLYNTLEVIRSEALINKDIQAAQISEALANYFRYNISRRSDIVSLGEELDNVGNYIKIQQMRFGERIKYIVQFHSDEGEARRAQIPKLSLQPLVENSIYHGLEKIAKGGTVTVHITVTADRLIIQVADDGKGMDDETLEKLRRHISENIKIEKEKDKRGGIALVNVNKRIKMLYGDEYGLWFNSKENFGTEATITMPYSTGNSKSI